MVREYRSLLVALGMHHVYREANRVVDKLAKKVTKQAGTRINFLIVPPVFVKEILPVEYTPRTIFERKIKIVLFLT